MMRRRWRGWRRCRSWPASRSTPGFAGATRTRSSIRATGDGMRLTLKQLVSAAGGVLRREELEALVAADVPPAEWPEGELRERVERVSDGEPLEPFLSLEQERMARRVRDGAREVAELSLDDVVVTAGGRERRWFEAEVEIRGEGREDDLERLAAALREECGLAPEPRAKFVRALELAEGGGVGLLPPSERLLHEAHAATATTADARGRRTGRPLQPPGALLAGTLSRRGHRHLRRPRLHRRAGGW